MKRLGLATALSLACLSLVFLGGCHGGGSTATVTIEIIPPATGTSVDIGATQLLTFTAALGDDPTNAGVTWSLSGSNCSGSGCGTLSNQSNLSVSYKAPPAPLPSGAALSVTLTATSVAQKSVTQTTTIAVEPLPTFSTTCNPAGVTTPCGLPGGSNGVGYNQPIAITGGVEPYTFAVTNSSPSLSSVCLNLTVTNTTNANTAMAGKPCNGGTTPTPLSFTVQVTDSGGAAPVSQTFAMTLGAATPLSITTPSLPAANLNANYSSAVNTAGGVAPLSFAATSGGLPSGLSLNATKGTITGTPDASDVNNSSCAPVQAGQYCFSVTVTDSALLPPNNQHQTQTKAFRIAVQQPGTLSITTPAGPLPAGTTAAGYNAPMQVTGGVPAYTWSVIQGQLPPGLILNPSNGNITGVPTVASSQPYAFTLQVQDSEITPQTAKAQFSIAIAAGQDNNSLFQGTYSFLFRGFDKDGSVAMIGTLAADGNGNISGLEVINRLSGVAPVASVTGTYTIDSAGTSGGTSGDGRGAMVLTSTVGQQTVTAAYQLALQSDGSIQFIQDHAYPTSPAPTNPDTFATHGAGVMKPVNGGSFGAASFSGNYAFEFTGEDTSSKPDALAGYVHADGSTQTLTSGRCDFNDAGNYGSQAISGDFAFGSGLGSAEFTLEVPKAGQQTLQFEYVFVSSSDLYFIEIDSSGSANAPTLYRLSGEMILQQPTVSFGQNSLAGAAVSTTSGVDSGGNAVVTAGLLTSTVCDGNTQNSLSFDQNDAGKLTSPSITDTCQVSPGGRVSFSWLSPSVAPPFVTAYLIAPGQGFLIGSDASVTAGVLEQQTAAQPVSNASVTGAYAISAPLIFEPGVNNLLGEVIADGSGNMTGTVDEAEASGASQTLDQPWAATIPSIAANGRGTMTTTGTVPAGFPTNWIVYVVSAGQIRALPADTSNTHPQLIFFGASAL